MITYFVKYDFFDKNFKLLENTAYYSTCFAHLYNMPQKSHYVKYFIEMNVTNEQAKEYLTILFCLFPFMKDIIKETIDEIIKKNCVTTLVENHQAMIFSTFTALRYLRDYKHIIENILEFKKKYSIEEAFIRAHDINTYEKWVKNGYISGIDMNSGHILIPCSVLQIEKWVKNFEKNFKPKDLENGSLNSNKIVHCVIQSVFYYNIIKETP